MYSPYGSYYGQPLAQSKYQPQFVQSVQPIVYAPQPFVQAPQPVYFPRQQSFEQIHNSQKVNCNHQQCQKKLHRYQNESDPEMRGLVNVISDYFGLNATTIRSAPKTTHSRNIVGQAVQQPALLSQSRPLFGYGSRIF